MEPPAGWLQYLFQMRASGIWSVSDMVWHSQDYHPTVNMAIFWYPASPFLQKEGLCCLVTQLHQKYYFDTVKKSLWRYASGTAASTVNGLISSIFNCS